MKISIITTCYNREATISDAIQSVLAQDYAELEYIIVDGASTDGSLDKIHEAIAGHEERVKLISESDHGMYEAINKGIRMATGDYIGLCHSDDIMYANDTVSRVAQQLKSTQADFLYADGLFVDADNLSRVVRRWMGGRYSRWRVRNGWLPLHPTCYIKKELYTDWGLYDEQYKIAADTDLLVRYLLRKELKVTYLHEFVTRMRMGGMSTDNAKRKKMWQEDIRVYRNHGFRCPNLVKIEKMMWKVPQFILAKIVGER